uniref:sigma-54-dependent transcriptional regulator n=1 Tax=Marinobacterium profundum TaxID=1714300 RepID=UPI00082EBB08|nr:sigma-54 dependent transcriptional regulator [Marinobacterium profundum]
MTQQSRYDVVIVEDSISTAALYKAYLDSEGYSTRVYHSGQEALRGLRERPPRVVMQDIRLPDMDGLDILRIVTEEELPVAVVVMTANSSVELVVEAMRRGGVDFIEKPFSKERLLVTVANAMKQQELVSMVQTYRDTIDRQGFHGIQGRSLALQVVYRLLDSAVNSKASLFLTGPTGTGKSLCARAVHQAGPRAEGPFVTLNCAAISDESFEAQLLGEQGIADDGGAGAACRADKGTLFIDEICELSAQAQVKLLGFIQTGQIPPQGDEAPRVVDVRIVCATSREPEQEVAAGRFRQDLYFRLNVVPVKMPPLNERESDVLILAEQFLGRFAKQHKRDFAALSADVRAAFVHYDWPGNVRELENTLLNVVLQHQGDTVELDMLPVGMRQSGARSAYRLQGDLVAQPKVDAADDTSGGASIVPLWLAEKQIIEQAIEACEGRVAVAAAHLGVSAATIFRKQKEWDEQQAE